MKFTNVNLLDELNKPECLELRRAFHERAFSRQAVIFEPSSGDPVAGEMGVPSGGMTGQSGNYVFIVRTGRIRVYLAYGDKEFTIAVLQPGDVYVSHSNAYVRALDNSTVMLTDTPTFNRRMMALPEFSVTVVRVLGGILKNAFSIIDGLALRAVSGRLARHLLETAQRSPEGQGTIKLGISGELLAQTLGASRQTVSTLLTDLIRSGILQKEKRGIFRIIDESRLRELL